MKKIVAFLLIALAFCTLIPVAVSALEITVFTPGDVNTDNVVNDKDAELLLDLLAGIESEDAKKPDVNRDGNVDNVDAVLLLKFLAGYDVELCKDPNEGWTGDY
ncbi:MAG: hypothetical protein IJN63_01435 [Clostridia bacterium]|nr:hypothetical protein [Clostridia bacterium]